MFLLMIILGSLHGLLIVIALWMSYKRLNFLEEQYLKLLILIKNLAQHKDGKNDP